MPTAQEIKARDQLWKDAYLKWYDSDFNENVSYRLVSRWQAFNDPAKLIIAVTASGSVIAGWTLWNEPGFKTFWIILAGVGALLSVISSSLTIPERIRDWINTKSDFSGVRLQVEILMTKMRLTPEFDIVEASKSMENITTRFTEAVNRMRNDLLHTDKLDTFCKEELDRLISERKLWQ